jgi:hypothetical protein
MNLKQLMSDLILWFDNKKTYINSVTLIVVPYLVATNYITAELGTVICGVIGILTGAGKYVSNQAVANNTELGIAIKNQRLK